MAILDFELATGNNSTLYDHGGQMILPPIEPERIALNLLTFQYFSSGGGSPVAQWKATRNFSGWEPGCPVLVSVDGALFAARRIVSRNNAL